MTLNLCISWADLHCNRALHITKSSCGNSSITYPAYVVCMIMHQCNNLLECMIAGPRPKRGCKWYSHDLDVSCQSCWSSCSRNTVSFSLIPTVFLCVRVFFFFYECAKNGHNVRILVHWHNVQSFVLLSRRVIYCKTSVNYSPRLVVSC